MSTKEYTRAPDSGALFFIYVLVFLLFILQAIEPAYANAKCAFEEHDELTRVQHIYDGDTLRLVDGTKIRLIGVNTPELGKKERAPEPFAEKAKKHVATLLEKDIRVRVRYGKQRYDRHGRVLAHLSTIDGVNISAELLKQGLGFAILIPPNDSYSDCYVSQEEKARGAGKNVWSHSYFKPRNADELNINDTGFRIVSDSVKSIKKTNRSYWLKLGNNFQIRIAKKDLKHFASMPEEWLGKTVEARGWVYYYKGELRMRVYHPKSLQIILN